MKQDEIMLEVLMIQLAPGSGSFVSMELSKELYVLSYAGARLNDPVSVLFTLHGPSSFI